jgi:tetratricopeptide (TPR) repeat protein
MIVRNAAPALRETLQSLQGVPAEIVVLDTGSTDDTPLIAQQFGAVLHSRAWDDDFSAARNACLRSITSDWILWLDAGEQLPADSIATLQQAFASGPVPVHAASIQLNPERAYLLPIVLPIAPGQIGGEQTDQVRLHPRHDLLKFSGRVRERLDNTLLAAGLSLEPLELPILRSARDHDPELRATRAQRNVRLADLSIAESGPSASMLNCLGESLQTLGDPLRAARHYQKALELATAKSADQLEAYYGLLTCLDSSSEGRQAQLSLCMQALERFPLDAQLLVALGGYLQSLDQLPLAVRSYDVAFRHGQTETRLWHLPDIREIAAACAVAAYDRLGQSDDAQTLLAAAIRTFPHSSRLTRQHEAASATAPTGSASAQLI